MRPDRFQVRDEAIDELNEMVERLFQCVDDINDFGGDFGVLLPDAHEVLHDKLIKSACEVREIVHVLKNNLAVFPITHLDGLGSRSTMSLIGQRGYFESTNC